ncbi:hypothetical protein GQ42DRAFT_161182, partial [Ramicandelaber brevisporus]
MNTRASVFYGWGVLTAACGLAYYLAMKDDGVRMRDEFQQTAKKSQSMSMDWREHISSSKKAALIEESTPLPTLATSTATTSTNTAMINSN